MAGSASAPTALPSANGGERGVARAKGRPAPEDKPEPAVEDPLSRAADGWPLPPEGALGARASPSA